MKKYISEFIGTAVLVAFGCGSAITNGFGAGYVGIALAFGLVIVAMAYSIGNISGCHINPAVSLAMLISKKMSVKVFIGYVISQVLGAIAGAALLLFLFGTENGLGTNAYGAGTDANLTLIQALVAEVVLTFTFVMAILGVTSKKEFSSVAGVVIGLSLTLVHIMGLPLTGTSVNPARSFGPALLMGGEALSQVWVFIVAPFIGAAIAAVVYNFLASNKEA